MSGKVIRVTSMKVLSGKASRIGCERKSSTCSNVNNKKLCGSAELCIRDQTFERPAQNWGFPSKGKHKTTCEIEGVDDV